MKTVTVSRCCEIEMTSASVCLATLSAVRCRVPVSLDAMAGSGMSWTFAYTSLCVSLPITIAPSILASS